MGTPEFQEILSSMKNDVVEFGEDWIPPLTETKTKEMFKHLQEKKYESFENLAQFYLANPSTKEKIEIAKMVNRAKLDDLVYTMCQIDEDEFLSIVSRSIRFRKMPKLSNS
jgi:hypothetical protein